jgi:hypothetical protein
MLKKVGWVYRKKGGGIILMPAKVLVYILIFEFEESILVSCLCLERWRL